MAKRMEAIKLLADKDVERVRLSDVADVIRGVTYKKDDATAKPATGLVAILRANNIQDRRLITDEELVFVPKDLVGSEQLLRKGDVVIATSSGSKDLVGKAAPLREDWRGSFGAFCAAVRPKEDIEPLYLAHFFESPEYKDLIRKKALGVNINNLRRGDLEDLKIPLAPLPEQRRIVSAIETQLGRLDAAVASLHAAKAKLKRYKQAVLKAAVEGRLTEEWREKNPDVIPADEALSSNLTKRRLDWEQAKLKEFGKPPRTNAWKEKYKEPPTIETEELPDLPEGWTWVGLEQVAAAGAHALKAGPFGSALKKEFYVAKGYKVYGQEQVISGDPYFGDYYIDEDRFDSLKACAVKPGDLLISLVGTIGRVLILPADIEPGIINPRLVKISLDTSVILPEYLKAYLESPYAKYLFSLSTHGGTMEILNLGILKELPIPLPPIKEQQMLLQIMDKVSSSDNEVETTLDAQLQQAVRLRQAVLKRAFEGRLG